MPKSSDFTNPNCILLYKQLTYSKKNKLNF